MKSLSALIILTAIAADALAVNPIEKIEQRFPKDIGAFRLTKKATLPAETNRVMFQYVMPSKANVVLTITELHPTRENMDIDGAFQKFMADYAKSEPARTISKLPDFPDSLIGQGCGPKFQQLNFRSKGRVYSNVHNNFGTVIDRHFVRISFLQDEGTMDQKLEVDFLNRVRAALGECKE